MKEKQPERVNSKDSDILKKMKYLIYLIRNRTGREEIKFKVKNHLWPLLRLLATFYRKCIVYKVKFIVVIGSSGKTTTVNALKKVFNENIKLGFVSNSFGSVAFDVLSVYPWQKYKVLEVGIGAPAQMEQYGKMLHPDIIVITKIGLDHIQNFKNKEEIRDEKAKILPYLKNGGTIVANYDDKDIRHVVNKINTNKVFYGFEPKSDIYCRNYKLKWPVGSELCLQIAGVELNIDIKLIGQHLAYPIMVAIAVSNLTGQDLNKTKKKLHEVEPAYGRLQIDKLSNGVFLLRDDYKSSIESIEAALKVLEQIPANRKWVIFGDIGYIDYDEDIFASVASKIVKVADKVIFIHPNEIPLKRGALEGGILYEDIFLTDNKWMVARNILLENLISGDVVLIKGRRKNKLERISLALLGEEINCRLEVCPLLRTYCKGCSFKRNENKFLNNE